MEGRTLFYIHLEKENLQVKHALIYRDSKV